MELMELLTIKYHEQKDISHRTDSMAPAYSTVADGL